MVFMPGNIPWNKDTIKYREAICFGCGRTLLKPAWFPGPPDYCSQDCFKADPVLKMCKECGRTLPASEFYRQGKSKLTGRQYYKPRCKKCDAPRKYMAQAERRALKAGAEPGLSEEGWKAVLEFFGYKCAYCGDALEEFSQDHFTPLSKGGSHTAGNVLPSCRRCNSSKSNSLPQEWLHPIKFGQLSAVLGLLG